MVEKLIRNRNPNKIPPPLGENSPASVAYSSFFDKINLSHETRGTLYESHAKLYSTLNDFCGNQIHNLAYNAAMLTGIYRLQDDFVLSRNARRALRDSFTQCDTEGNAKYMLGLLWDEEKINDFWRANASEQEYTYNNQDAWMLEPRSVDFDRLGDQIRITNLESHLIASAKTLNYLYAHGEKTLAVLDKIQHAQSILAPICETIGFDGLAMAQNNAGSIIQFNNTDRSHYIDLAQSILNRYGSSDMIFHAITDVIGECLGRNVNTDYDYAVNSLPNSPLHRILFMHGIADSKATGGELDIKGRLKTVGSLAKKLYGSEKKYGRVKEPMDITAITIVTADVEQSAKIFELIEKNTNNSKNIKLVPSPSKEKALFIQGEESFINKICGTRCRDNIQTETKSSDEAIQVAKVTFEYRPLQMSYPLRMEVQIVTLADRMAMRYGAHCHPFAYKIGRKLNKKALDVLDEVHDRREYIGQAKLVAPDAELDAEYERIINVDQDISTTAGRYTVRKTVDL